MRAESGSQALSGLEGRFNIGTVTVSGLRIGSTLCVFGGLVLLVLGGGTGMGLPIIFVGLLSASTAQILQRQSTRIDSLERQLAKRDGKTETEMRVE
jgi:hypothetical protein